MFSTNVLSTDGERYRRKNKRFIFGYLEYLVRQNFFDGVLAPFPPIGHTSWRHWPRFLWLAHRRCVTNGVTCSDLHQELCCAYYEFTMGTSMRNGTNISELFKKTNSIRCAMPSFFYFRYFRFCLRDKKLTGFKFGVNFNAGLSWLYHEEVGFHCHTPSLSATPATLRTSPNRLPHVTKRILLEDYRIHYKKKMVAFFSICDLVFWTPRKHFTRI